MRLLRAQRYLQSQRLAATALTPHDETFFKGGAWAQFIPEFARSPHITYLDGLIWVHDIAHLRVSLRSATSASKTSRDLSPFIATDRIHPNRGLTGWICIAAPAAIGGSRVLDTQGDPQVTRTNFNGFSGQSDCLSLRDSRSGVPSAGHPLGHAPAWSSLPMLARIADGVFRPCHR